jgi:hypothetical protein
LAYVVVPTVYVYKDHGNDTAEVGSLTFLLRAEADGGRFADGRGAGSSRIRRSRLVG